MLVQRLPSRDGPKRGIRQQAADELSMQGVAGFMCFHAAQQGQSCQSQVANQVERLVAAEFIRKAQGAVDQVLDVRQQARFRVFEENMERRKLELLARARQANRARKPQ